MRRRPVQLDFGEDFPATLPFPLPASRACPTEEFSVLIPPSSEAMVLGLQVFGPAIADQARVTRKQTRVELLSGAVLLVNLEPSPAASRLLAGGS